MAERPDIQRLVGDLIRFGTIATVDVQRARCTVAVGDLTTGAIPWLTYCAGDTSLWSPPSVGEQVLLLCPEGDTAAGVAVRGIYSDANPAPASADKLQLIRFADGSIVSYDAAANHLAVTLVDGATAAIAAPGGLTITGPVHIVGALDVSQGVTAQGDVTAKGVSLHDHVHTLVKAGTDKSGGPA